MLTSSQLSKVLNISEFKLKRLRKEGLPHRKLGHKMIRFVLSEVEEWLLNRCGVGETDLQTNRKNGTR